MRLYSRAYAIISHMPAVADETALAAVEAALDKFKEKISLLSITEVS